MNSAWASVRVLLVRTLPGAPVPSFRGRRFNAVVVLGELCFPAELVRAVHRRQLAWRDDDTGLPPVLLPTAHYVPLDWAPVRRGADLSVSGWGRLDPVPESARARAATVRYEDAEPAAFTLWLYTFGCANSLCQCV